MSLPSRRQFHATAVSATAALTGTAAGLGYHSEAAAHKRPSHPIITDGVMSGDVTGSRAIIWARCDRPAQMMVQWSRSESFEVAHRARGSAALEVSDYTARVDLKGLPPGERIFYRVWFEDLARPKIISPAVTGSLQTASQQRAEILFAWSGDTAGQGWGINPDFGGMRIYQAIRRQQPQFFVHCGDNIYADGPIPETITLDNGSLWKNLVTEAKSRVAQTLNDFRGNYRYNLLDENLKNFHAEVPLLTLWDDHETTNNWYPGEILKDERYQVTSSSLLAARARKAFLEYTPIRSQGASGRIYRSFSYGPQLELFLLDQRTYRGPNSVNSQPEQTPEAALMGAEQLAWLKASLLASRATWKVICADMPIGLIVGDGPGVFENGANGDGPAVGRELEYAELFRFVKHNQIHNLVWLTADVHYAAAHRYDPYEAQFTEFLPFWEFVAGPLNAGTFGPNPLDNTFGPKVEFASVPAGMKPNRPPVDGKQYFGTVRIEPTADVMTVELCDLNGKSLYSVELIPQRVTP